jgi:hypothetical protein
MAALVELDRYVPLAEVIDNFYTTHHEISYLESAGLLSYLVDVYGWPRVRDFYSQATPDDGDNLSTAVDVNLRRSFGQSLAQVEADLLAHLKTLPRDRSAVNNLRLTIDYYDLMRRYQVAYDPTAYYLYAWLPAPEEAERRNTTADFIRHPATLANIALETMFKAANDALLLGDYSRAEGLLNSVERVMDNKGRFLDPVAKAYLEIVQTVADKGYEAHQIEMNGNQAQVMVSRPDDNRLRQLQLALDNEQVWTLIR